MWGLHNPLGVGWRRNKMEKKRKKVVSTIWAQRKNFSEDKENLL